MAKHLLQFNIHFIEGNNTLQVTSIPDTMYYSGGINEIRTIDNGFKFFQMGSRNEPPKYIMGEDFRLMSRDTVYNGVVPSNFADMNGNFINGTNVFVLTGTNLTGFGINFDLELDEYATIININGINYNNSSPTFAVVIPETNIITIELKQWSKPYVTAKVTAIYNNIMRSYTNEIVDGTSSLLQLTRCNQSLSDNITPEFGIIGRYGSVQLIDYDNFISDLCNNNSLFSGIQTQTILDGQVIDNQLIREIKYSYGDRIVDMQLYSKLENLNFISIPSNLLIIRERVTLFSIFNDLKAVCVDNNIYFEPLTLELSKYLYRIEYPLIQLEQKALLEQLGDVCKAGMLLMFENNKGRIEVITYPQ